MAKGLQIALTVGGKGRVTLPDEVRKHLGVEEGDVILLDISETDTAQMIPVALVPRDQVWFSHPDARARISEAHDDIAADRTTTVRSKAELKAHLAKLKQAGRSD